VSLIFRTNLNRTVRCNSKYHVILTVLQVTLCVGGTPLIAEVDTWYKKGILYNMISPTLLKLLKEASLSEPVTLSGSEVLYEVNLAYPGLAEALLAVNNERNRPANSANAIRMRRSLSKGKWLFDGSPLRVNSDGIMDDGQHRSKEVTDALASGMLEAGSVLRSLVLTEMPP
jgi:hypothetical protein